MGVWQVETCPCVQPSTVSSLLSHNICWNEHTQTHTYGAQSYLTALLCYWSLTRSRTLRTGSGFSGQTSKLLSFTSDIIMWNQFNFRLMNEWMIWPFTSTDTTVEEMWSCGAISWLHSVFIQRPSKVKVHAPPGVTQHLFLHSFFSPLVFCL